MVGRQHHSAPVERVLIKAAGRLVVADQPIGNRQVEGRDQGSGVIFAELFFEAGVGPLVGDQCLPEVTERLEVGARLPAVISACG